MIVQLDKTYIRLMPPDLDGDGRVGGIENITRLPEMDRGVTPMTHKGELAEAMDSLNDDRVDPKTNMSNIDFHANTMKLQATSCSVIEHIISVPFLPIENIQFTRQIKRNTVSINGLGRKQKTEMVTGERNHQKEKSNSVVSRFKGMFNRGDDD